MVALVGLVALMPAAKSSSDAIGQVTQYPLNDTTNAGIADLLTTLDGQVWFAQFYANQINRISKTGQISSATPNLPPMPDPVGSR